MAGIISKLVSGGGSQKSRLHDIQGNRVSASRLVRNGPQALITGIGRLAFNVRPERPWMSFDAQTALAKVLGPGKRVLEFGSGMSTVWYARQAAEVVSVDNYEPWYEKVREILAARNITNVHYRFASAKADYCSVPDGLLGDGFDVVIVDGVYRDDCARTAIGCVRPGGVIYLDNADRKVADSSGDVPAARRALLDHARAHGWTVEFYTDFAPTQLFVEQGMLVRRPA